MSEQTCPICSAPVEPNVRYRDYICFECCEKAVDETGRKLGFGNEAMSGGFAAWYEDTLETRESHICFIDGVKCWADEAHMGGIVIRRYEEVRFGTKMTPTDIKMKLKPLILLLAFCLTLAACSGSPENTNTSSGANAANSAPAANNANTATGYPQASVDAFLRSCEEAGSDKAFCTCVLEKVQAKYSFEEFSTIESQIQAGEPSQDFIDFSAKARAECTR